MQPQATLFSDIIEKFNPYHDSRGRFTTANGFASFSANPNSKAGKLAIDRAQREHPLIGLANGTLKNPKKKPETNKPKRKRKPKEKPIEEKEIRSKVGQLLDKPVQYSKYGNGEPAPYRRIIENDIEHTLVGKPDDFQGMFYYVGNIVNGVPATVTRIKEGRREDNLVINGERARFASLLANKIRSVDDMHICTETKKSFYESDNDNDNSPSFQIHKTDEDKRLVFGWALVSATSDGQQIIDHQGDIVDQDELEEGAYEYVLNFRDAGEEHIGTLRKKARMVESVVFTDEKLQAMGIPAGTVPYGWWIGFYVDDDRTWELIKNGTYKMFSIEGRAIREPINDLLSKSDYEPEFELEVAKTFSELIEKFNPYHDRLGRFTTGSSASFMTMRTKDPNKQHMADKAIARAKERQSSGNSTKAIEIESPDGTKLSYRVRSDGSITDMNGVEPKNTNGMTIDQLVERGKKLGWKVTTYDDKQLKDYDSKRAERRKETDKLLNDMSSRDRSTTYRAPRKGWKGH